MLIGSCSGTRFEGPPYPLVRGSGRATCIGSCSMRFSPTFLPTLLSLKGIRRSNYYSCQRIESTNSTSINSGRLHQRNLDAEIEEPINPSRTKHLICRVNEGARWQVRWPLRCNAQCYFVSPPPCLANASVNHMCALARFRGRPWLWDLATLFSFSSTQGIERGHGVGTVPPTNDDEDVIGVEFRNETAVNETLKCD